MKPKYGNVIDMNDGSEIKVVSVEFYQSVIGKKYTGEVVSAYSQDCGEYIDFIVISKLPLTIRARIEFAIAKDKWKK
jgi:hypothetical protein